MKPPEAEESGFVKKVEMWDSCGFLRGDMVSTPQVGDGVNPLEYPLDRWRLDNRNWLHHACRSKAVDLHE